MRPQAIACTLRRSKPASQWKLRGLTTAYDMAELL